MAACAGGTTPTSIPQGISGVHSINIKSAIMGLKSSITEIVGAYITGDRWSATHAGAPVAGRTTCGFISCSCECPNVFAWTAMCHAYTLCIDRINASAGVVEGNRISVLVANDLATHTAVLHTFNTESGATATVTATGVEAESFR